MHARLCVCFVAFLAALATQSALGAIVPTTTKELQVVPLVVAPKAVAEEEIKLQPYPEQPSHPYLKGMPEKSLLIAVITAPNHFHARAAIRHMYQTYATSNLISRKELEGITLRFFIGELDVNNPNITTIQEKLRQEAASHPSDMVMLSGFVENYANLTRKTIAMISWAKENGYKSLFKMDDDTFLRLENLVQYLKSEAHPEYIYAGAFVSDNQVNDNPDSKWYNKDLYPHDIYPDYASGPGYYLGGYVIDQLYQLRHQLKMYRVEDAAVGIWSQNFTLIDRVSLVVQAYAATCDDNPDIIYVNPVNSDEMRTLMKNVMEGSMCKQGFQLAECVARPCLCHPAPEDCDFSSTKNWLSFSNEKYQDLIPRLVQTQQGVAKAQSHIRSPVRGTGASL